MNLILVYCSLISAICIGLLWCYYKKQSKIENFSYPSPPQKNNTISPSQQRKTILENINDVLNNITQRDKQTLGNSDEGDDDRLYLSNSA